MSKFIEKESFWDFFDTVHISHLTIVSPSIYTSSLIRLKVNF